MFSVVTGSVGRRIGWAFGVVAVLFVISIGLAVASAHTQASSAVRVAQLQHIAGQVKYLHFYDADVTGWQAFVVLDAVQGGAGAALDSEAVNLSGLRESHTALDEDLAAIDRTLLTNQERSTLAALEGLWSRYWDFDGRLQSALAEDTDAALQAAIIELNTGEGTVLYGDLVTAISELSSSLEARADHAAAAAARDARRGLTLALAVAGLALIVGAGLIVVTTRSITRPLRRAVHVLQEVAEGRLDRRVGLARGDEIGHLSAALDLATTNLAESMTTIARTATAVAGASGALSGTASQLTVVAGRSANQAECMADLAARVDGATVALSDGTRELTASIHEIADGAAGAASTATRALDLVRAADQIVTRLAGSSREIGGFVAVISTIAEQTNLLALNATIEAARAGQAGKGFAVVAGEVKELARESARATDDITTRVSAIQADAASAAQAIAAVRDVVGSIDQTQAAIASAVAQQSATTDQMNRHVEAVTTGATQISGSITAVAEAATDTTRSADQTASAAGDLAALSTELDRMLTGIQF